VEIENHYYNFTHTALESLGLKPHLLSETLLHHMFDVIEAHRDRVDLDLLKPTVNWRSSHRTKS
jgi:UDP-sulfoquinovose synthase